MHSSQFGITFTDSRGPVNSDGPIHCIRSLNRMVRYSVMPLPGQKKFKLRPSELEHNTTTEQQPTRALTNRMFNRLEEQYHESRKWKMKKQHRNSRQFRLRILSQPSQSTRTETLETPPMHLQSTETLQYQTSQTMGNDPTLLTRLCHRYTIQQ